MISLSYRLAPCRACLHFSHLLCVDPAVELCYCTVGVHGALYYYKASIMLVSLVWSKKVCIDIADNLILSSGCAKIFGAGES